MRCFLFVALFAAGASADEMGALRDAVGSLTGSAPISAAIVSGPGQKGDARTIWTVREVKAR